MRRSTSTRDPGRRPRVGLALALGLVWVVGLATVHAAALAVDAGGDPATDPDGDVQVLTRGPVHEAFATPVVNDAEPGLIVPKAPPQAVEEMPPDQKPEGENVQWISGYWSWDQSRDDFVWVSGVWREPPPGRQWVPGYWNQTTGGYQWTPGAWIPVEPEAAPQDAPTAQGPAAYLPAPPASLEVGPNVPAPSGQVFWSPGCWFWRHAHSRYVWRPGFWTVARPSWVWVPAHYVWTPGGYLFVEGYWDFPLVNRGLLFAPVYFARPVFLRPAYVYTPMITIATPGLMANLFVQPRYNHYVFGDYYDRSYLTVGIFPWFSFTRVSGIRPPGFYDPLFSYYSMVNLRTNPGWAAARRANYAMLRDNIAMRPPRTYIEQTRIVQNNINITRNVTVVNPGGRPAALSAERELGRSITQVAARQNGAEGLRMERINMESRRQLREQSVRLAEFRTQRAGREIEAAPRPGPGPRAGGPAAAPGGPRPRELAQAAPRARPFAMPQSPVAAPAPARPNRPQPPALQAASPTPHRLDPQAAQARADMLNARREAAPQRPERPQPQPRPQPAPQPRLAPQMRTQPQPQPRPQPQLRPQIQPRPQPAPQPQPRLAPQLQPQQRPQPQPRLAPQMQPQQRLEARPRPAPQPARPPAQAGGQPFPQRPMPGGTMRGPAQGAGAPAARPRMVPRQPPPRPLPAGPRQERPRPAGD